MQLEQQVSSAIIPKSIQTSTRFGPLNSLMVSSLSVGCRGPVLSTVCSGGAPRGPSEELRSDESLGENRIQLEAAGKFLFFVFFCLLLIKEK